MEGLKPEIANEIKTPTLVQLGPNGMSMEGFLSEGQTLEEVVKRDREALEILGYSKQEIADLLLQLNKAVEEDRSDELEYAAPNGKIYTVQPFFTRGWQDCPWRDGIPKGASMHMLLKEKGSDQPPVRIAGMMPHLIEKHDFFEGGSYRISPEEIVEMFGEERVEGSLVKAKSLQLTPK